MAGLSFWSATWLCTRAAAAEAALLALFFVIAALVVRDAAWPIHLTFRATATFFVACLLSTVGIERWAIATARWSFGDGMPLIFGVGALPLLQWILIPAVAVLSYRMVESSLMRRARGGGDH